jgi:cytochrome P450
VPDHPTNPQVRLHDRFFYVDAHAHFRWLREHAPVYWDETADGGLWGIARYDDIMAVSRQPELFSSAKSSRPERIVDPSMINLDDPHKRRRNLVNRGFTPRRVAAHEPVAEAHHGAARRGLARGGESDRGGAVDPDGGDRRHARHAARAPRQLLRWSDELLGGGEVAAIEDDERRAPGVSRAQY